MRLIMKYRKSDREDLKETIRIAEDWWRGREGFSPSRPS
jgi:hypothetical protein